MPNRSAIALFGLPRRAEPAMPVARIGIDNHGSVGRIHRTSGKNSDHHANKKYSFHDSPFYGAAILHQPAEKRTTGRNWEINHD